MDNKIQRNAIAFERLANIEYYICLSEKKKGFAVRLRFSKDHFAHLEGIGQLKDIGLHQKNSVLIFNQAKRGLILESDLKKSEFYESSRIQGKIDYLNILEDAIDQNDTVFRYNRMADGRIKIEAKLLMYSAIGENDIYVYLDQTDANKDVFYCRSFIANPDFDRTIGQRLLTVLWKEKVDLLTGERQLLYQFKDFTPEQLIT